MLRSVWRKTLRDQRRALLGWGIGIAGLAVLYATFYPSVRDNAGQLNSYLKNLPEALRGVIGGANFSSPAGYLSGEVFSTMGPLLLLVFAIGQGSRAIAGEEEAGTMDVLLSTPLSRTSLVVQKFAALGASTLLLGAILFLTLWVAGPPFDLRVPAPNLAAACLQTVLLALSFGAIALAAGCASGRRTFALGVAAAAAVLAYLLNVLAPSVRGLDGLRTLSPFYLSSNNDPLANGIGLAYACVLAGITIVALAAGVVAFDRRDLAA